MWFLLQNSSINTFLQNRGVQLSVSGPASIFPCCDSIALNDVNEGFAADSLQKDINSRI
jgi:hypothetical protein